MFYLGQAVSYKKFNNSPQLAAIVTGFSGFDNPIITFVNTDGELKKHEQAWSIDCKLVRQKDKKSPTGYSIYHGVMYKEGFIQHVKLKLPEDAVLIKELKTIQKILDSKE